MPRRKKKPAANSASPEFDAQRFLDSSDVTKKIVEHRPRSVIFAQGDPSDNVIYIQKGAVRLSVFSRGGKDAIVAMFGPGEFLGEGCPAGQAVRMATAIAVSPGRSSSCPRTR